MFTTVRNNTHVYSSDNVNVEKSTKITATSRNFSALARESADAAEQSVPSPSSVHRASIEQRHQDNAMRLHIMNASVENKDLLFRPATPRLAAKLHWQSVMATPQTKRHFLQAHQAGKSVGFTSEDNLDNFIVNQQARGSYCESNMDMGVACEPNAMSNGTSGAGPCIAGFVRAIAENGVHTLASIHVGLDGENPLTPEAAYAQVINPLAQKVAEQTGHAPGRHYFYFAGGNTSTFDSCVALAYAAQQHRLNVPVSMLGLNTEDTYMNAVMTKPTHSDPHGSFFVAKVDD